MKQSKTKLCITKVISSKKAVVSMKAEEVKPPEPSNPLVYTTKNGNKLTLQQWTFCKHYVDMMGGGTQAALAAYHCEGANAYNTANAISRENLQKPPILECIRELLDSTGLNDEVVDAELSFVIKQHENIPGKVAGIREYNQMKGRHAAEKHTIETSPLLERLLGGRKINPQP